MLGIADGLEERFRLRVGLSSIRMTSYGTPAVFWRIDSKQARVRPARAKSGMTIETSGSSYEGSSIGCGAGAAVAPGCGARPGSRPGCRTEGAHRNRLLAAERAKDDRSQTLDGLPRDRPLNARRHRTRRRQLALKRSDGITVFSGAAALEVDLDLPVAQLALQGSLGGSR